MPLSAFSAMSPRLLCTQRRCFSTCAQLSAGVLVPSTPISASCARLRMTSAAARQAFAAGEGLVVDHHHTDAVVGQVARAVLAAGAAADDDDGEVPVAFG